MLYKPGAKPEERRRTERHAMRGMGKISGGVGSLPRDCWISDLFDGGARLHSEADIPDHFTLTLPDGVQRECRIVWRLEHEVGVAFTGGFMPGFGKRAAGRA
jgi:hypothetical protein